MKKHIALASALVITFNAFSYDDKTKSADHMAQQVVSSLQQSSAEAFVELIPTLEDFYQIMEANARVYGPNLKEAKQEFASTYVHTILPEAMESFEALLLEGEEEGIIWKSISYVRLEAVQGNNEQSIASFDIVVAANNKEFKIRVKSALQINGQWKASQFVKLI